MVAKTPVLELVKPEKKKRRAPSGGVDPVTRQLRRLLLEKDRLRDKVRENDRALLKALTQWSDRPGEGGGIATEGGARYILTRCGLLPGAPSREISEEELASE